MERVVTDEMLRHASNLALMSFLFEARESREFQEKQEKRIIDELHKRITGESVSSYRLRCDYINLHKSVEMVIDAATERASGKEE